ncbi:hypothetical protein S726_002182 [Salmonella enterica subsp. enterica]|nr:hypothetical protein [Salmonella enterica subsp. enterica]
MAKENKAVTQKTAGQQESGEVVLPEVTEQQSGAVTQKVTADEVKKAVKFIVPWKRYSRDDIAVFSAEQAEDLVDRGAAEWTDKKRKKAAPEDENTHETDIG